MTQTERGGNQIRRWLGLMDAFGVEEAAARSLFEVVRGRYEEEGRFYHTLNHVQQVLATVERLAPYAEDVAVVKLAAWFHDAVYEPGGDDNEARSARTLCRTLQPHPVPAAAVEEAARLILLTEGHETAADDGNGHVLLDADLAILGAEAAAYRRYAEAVRREFAHVPEEAYRRGRAEVLRHFLERKSLYFTPPMRAEREARARRNMRREMGILGDGRS